LAVNRAGSAGQPELKAGTELTVEAGGCFVTDQTEPAIRNDSAEPATYQFAVIDQADPEIVDPCQPLG
jgi:hypothetical protein